MWNASPICSFSRGRAHPAPGWSCLDTVRIAGRNEHLQFMRFQTPRRPGCTRRPKTKMPRGQTLLAKPKSLRIVRDHFYGSPASVSEDVQRTRKRIFFQVIFADPCQTIDATSEIYRLHRHQNAHLSRNLYHDSRLQKLRLSAARSGAGAPLTWMRMRPPRG
jgi:hypothetical protein